VIFTPTPLPGVLAVDLERRDGRARLLRAQLVPARVPGARPGDGLVQCSVSFNRRRGTLRGMHYQVAPHREAKLVRCTMGALYDVVLDLRPDSPTYRRWHGMELSAENRSALFIPPGVAHGFQTLDDNTEVFYQMDEFFAPDSARGVRWNDPAFAIAWPLPDPILSERDRGYPDYQEPALPC
jgi:dTDP-4-dehydrorhamnose 3,5-epimerase